MTTCCMMSWNSWEAAYWKDQHLAAMVLNIREPRQPGKVPLSRILAYFSLQKTIPLRALQKVLVVEEVTKSA